MCFGHCNKIKNQSGLSKFNLTIDDNIWPLIIRPLGYDSGIRSLERTLETICRRVARMIVEKKVNNNGNFTINAENLKQFVTT